MNMKITLLLAIFGLFLIPNAMGECSLYYGCGANGKCWAGCTRTGGSINGPEWCYTSNVGECVSDVDCKSFRCESCRSSCVQ